MIGGSAQADIAILVFYFIFIIIINIKLRFKVISARKGEFETGFERDG
jgi:hypothetical protein